MATLYLAISLFGMVWGIPLNSDMTIEECATTSSYLPMTVCVME